MAKTKWISPSAAMDMVFDDPMGPMEDFSFALLRKRSKGHDNTTEAFARAKLQPREPRASDARPEGEWPVTATDHELVLAPRVPDDWSTVETLFKRYDSKVAPRQKLLAVVLTLRFPGDLMRHDMMSVARGFTTERLAKARRLTSLLALHLPGEELSSRDPHIHVLTLARAHHPNGFRAECPDLLREDAQQVLFDEWREFKGRWEAGIA
jgi:hypothetical protein